MKQKAKVKTEKAEKTKKSNSALPDLEPLE